ncbi:MAG: Ig-like domain-containing protein [Pseudomonadales bacterium]|nr:Ig-like domain-containing protein [Pseudomonadales bacterium]
MNDKILRLRTIFHGARPINTLLFLLISLLLAACGGGSSSGGEGEQTERQLINVSRIELTPNTVMLTSLNDSRTLNPVAYDESGNVVDVEFTWESSNPAFISVNNNGVITNEDYAGSATITASAQGVSATATVLAVELMPNSVLISDTDVLGNPQMETPDAVPTVGTRYTVEIKTNVNVTVGDLLIASETARIGGRVVEVITNGNSQTVKLEMVPISELFATLKINEVYALNPNNAQVVDEVNALYNVTRHANGSFDFTPKPTAPGTAPLKHTLGASTAASTFGQALGTHQLFECSTTLPTIPLNLTGPALATGVTPDLNLIIQYDSAGENLQKLAVQGSLKLELKVKLTATAAFEGKVNCLMPLLRIPVPFNGAAAAYFGAGIWIGPGFEVGGKVTVAQAALEVGGSVEFRTEAGLEHNPSSGELEMIDVNSTSEILTQGDFKLSLPDANNITASIRFEPALKTFAFAELSVGLNSSLLGSITRGLDWSTLKATAGLVESYNLATVDAQVASTGYASDYKNNLNLNFGLSADAINFFQFFNFTPSALGLDFNYPLYTSPQLLEATANTETFDNGDTIEVTVKLKPNTLDYLSLLSTEPYNIDNIIIYRMFNEGGSISTEEMARTHATPGQTEFNLSWQADSTGEIASDFFVFVDTKVLEIPFTNINYPLFDELELGTITGVQWQILPEFPELIEDEVAETLTITVLDKNSNPVEGAILNFSAVGGSVSDTDGTTDSNGEFVTSAQLHTGETELIIEITAGQMANGSVDILAADSVSANVLENSGAQVGILNQESHLFTQADASNYNEGDYNENDLPFYNEQQINISAGPLTASCCEYPPGDSANSSASASINLHNALDNESGLLQNTAIAFSAQTAASASSTADNLTDIGVSGTGIVEFQTEYVIDVYEPTQFILSGTANSDCEYLEAVFYKGTFNETFEVTSISGNIFQWSGPSLNETQSLTPGQYYLRLAMRGQAGAYIHAFLPNVLNASESTSCNTQITITYQ